MNLSNIRPTSEVDYVIETGDYRYYFVTQGQLDMVLEQPQKNHSYVTRYAAEVYCKTTGRCIKHRTIGAEVANTILRRAGHVDI